MEVTIWEPGKQTRNLIAENLILNLPKIQTTMELHNSVGEILKKPDVYN